jgi:hypothetical protein
MPLVTTRASVAYGAGFGKILGSAVAPDTGAMFPIAMVNVGSAGSGTITFTSIPDTYKHLQIRVMGLYSASNPFANLRFNGDSNSVYWWHQLQGNGSSASAGSYGSLGTSIYFPADAVGSSIPTVQIADILDYTSTSKNKTVRVLEGYDANGSGTLRLASGLWSATPRLAITSISITTSSGNFNQYSQFALYGIKG